MRTAIRRPRLWPLGVVTALTTGFLAAGCAGGAASPGPNGTISLRLYGGDWQNLNPALATTFASQQMDMALYDRLLTYSSSGKFEPYLAKSWTASPTHATFKLRTDATCANGTPVTASVIKNSLDYLANSKAAASRASEVFGPGKPTITADNTTATLTVSLSQPYGNLLLGLSSVGASVICPAGVTHPSLMTSHDEGSGPFTLASSQRGSSYTLMPRKGYSWGPRGYKSSEFPFKKIVAYVITDETTAANELLTGSLDIASITGLDSRRVTKGKGIFSLKTSIPGSDILVMNEKPGLPGADHAVREAIFSLINPRAMNEAATNGLATLSNTMMSPTTLACYHAQDGTAAVRYNVAHAKSVLESDGWALHGGKWIKDGKQLTIRILMTTGYGSAPDYLQSTLANFGINDSVKTVDVNEYINVILNTGAWDLTYYPLPGPFPSVNNLTDQLSGPFPPAGSNFAHIVSPAFTHYASLAGARLATQGCPDWQAAERALLQRADIRPIAQENIDWFGRGVTFSAFGGALIDLTSLRRQPPS